MVKKLNKPEHRPKARVKENEYNTLKMSDFRIISLFFCLFLLSCESNAPRVHTDITGVWRCEETNNSTVSQTSYLLDVYRKASDTTQYVITNLFQTGDSEFIVVKLNNGKLTLTEQSITGMNVKSLSGTVIDLRNIQLSYTIYDGKRDNNINASFSRK